MYLLGMLALLFVANLCMLMGMTNWPQRTRENFAMAMVAGKPGVYSGKQHEGFMNMLTSADGSAFGTAAIGSYDGRNMASGLPPAAQGFRARMPNEPLAGPEPSSAAGGYEPSRYARGAEIEVGPDNLFIFANNQCKPECCGSTLSCDGGCVCTNSKQRDFINTRGGNRLHDDGF
jgi:hypothetical protein